MVEIIKNILFWTATISGSICLILLCLVILYRTILVFVDNMRNANVFRKCLMLYIHRNRPDIKIELKDIDIKNQGIHIRSDNNANNNR